MKNQHLTVQNKRRHLEWCSSMLERLGETKRLWEVSRKTRISRKFSGHCSLCSIPRFKRSFPCGFLWFFAVSLAAVFSLFLLFGVVCPARFAPCSCCCSHVHGRSHMETIRWQADASCSRGAASRRRLVRRVLFPAARAAQPSEHEDLLGSAISRNGLGTCLSRNLLRVHSIATQASSPVFGTFLSTLLPVETWSFSHPCHSVPVVTPKDLAVAQHFEDRCA